jgi:alanine-synthesizing transaminase
MFSRRTDWKLTPNRFTQVQRELAASGRQVLDLTISNPTRAGVHYDAESILNSLRNAAALDYDPQPKGLLMARQAVAAYYHDQHDVFDADPEALLLATSTSEAYSFVFRLLCNPEDEILVPAPSYPLFQFLADLQDVKLASYPLIYDHAWQIDFPSLYKAVNPRTRAVLVVHPNNPTGSFTRPDEVGSLNRFCREYNLALVADEVFLDYPHDGVSRQTFASNRDVLTFTLSGLSKVSGMPQMKVAWVSTSGPENQLKDALARLEVIADTYLSMNAPLQLATPVLLEQRKNFQPLLLDRLRTNLGQLANQLTKQDTCSLLRVEGGWYAILRVPVTHSDEELAVKLLQDSGVVVHPGTFYDFSSDGYLIVSLITSPQIFREGITRVLKYVGHDR